MSKKLGKILQYVFGGIAIFLFGLLIGRQINCAKNESLQEGVYKASSKAALANAMFFDTGYFATMYNATNPNLFFPFASNFNATNYNATNPNATNGNYRQTYNLLMLNNFVLLDHTANVGDKVNLTLNTDGACLIGATLVIKKDDLSYNFSAPVKSVNGFPYIIIPYDVPSGSYYVDKILSTGRNYDYSTFTITHSGDYITKEKLQINNKESSIILNTISLKQQVGNIGEQVDLQISTSEPSKTIKLLFTSISGSAFEVFVKSISSNPYFLIPSTVTVGDYKLTRVSLTTKDGIKEYLSDSVDVSKKLQEDILLRVNKGTATSYVYDNANITSDANNEILHIIYVAPENIDITINAESDSLIGEAIFNTIKGTNKNIVINFEDNQIIFNGTDIETPKSIDASIRVSSVEDYNNIKKIINNGVVVSFADNGDLPGKANVRIKSSDLLNNILGNKKIYLYLYNEEDNNFTEIDSEVTKSDDFYEFSINHNSDYLLVTEKIDKKYIAESGNVVSFQRGDRTNLVLIICGTVLVIATILTVIVVNKNTRTSTTEITETSKKEKKESKKE